MSQVPPPFVPGTSYTTYAELPILTAGLPGTQLDQDMRNIASSVNATESRLSEIQRDDGALRNGIVNTSALSSEVLALITAQGGTLMGSWRPFYSYNKGDVVVVLPYTWALPMSSGSITPDPRKPLICVRLDSNGRPVFEYDPTGTGSLQITLMHFMTSWVLLYSESGSSATWSKASMDYDPHSAGVFSPLEGATGFPTIETYKEQSPGTYICVSDHVSTASFNNDSPNWALIASTQPVGDLVVSDFEGDGVETEFSLATNPVNENNTQVYINGLYISKSEYTLSGDKITFAEAPANESKIEVVSGVTVQVPVYAPASNSVGTSALMDEAVTTPKLASGAVTAAKIENGAVGTNAIGDDSISSSKMQANSVTNTALAAGAVTGGKITDNSIPAAKLVDNTINSNKVALGGISRGNIANSAIDASKLDTDAVETAKVKDGAITAPKMASGAIVTSLGYTPANKAGDTFTGAVTFDVSALAPNTPKSWASVVPRTSDGAATINQSFNVASVTRAGAGIYEVVFDTALPDANYAVLMSVAKTGSIVTVPSANTLSTTGFKILVERQGIGPSEVNVTGLYFTVMR